jgi:hypothetical protein
MACAGCHSRNQAEMNTEINIHYSGTAYPGNPGLFVFPTVMVCLDCGVSQFIVGEDELAQIVAHSPKSKPPSVKPCKQIRITDTN